MKTAFIIYCRAVGLYALFTLPVIAEPAMYIISLMYVLMYGWFAWLVFTVLYVITDNFLPDFAVKIFSLFTAVVIAVAIAYHMLGVLKVEEDVWHSRYIFFPFIAVIAGWTSVCMSGKRIRNSYRVQQQNDQAL